MMNRVMFDSLESAVEALIVVLDDAEETDKEYTFGPISASQMYVSGLLLIGDIEDIAAKLDGVRGTTRYTE